MVSQVPPEIKEEINLSFAISNKIDALMQERGLSKKEFADQIGKRPSEITRWLSGQHNFTVSTLAMLSAFFGSLPTATYSQNVGIVTTNKVVNRVVFALAGGFLLLAGLIPKFSAILTTIPQCVLGGATITVFSTIAMTGMKLIASETISPRNTTIVGLSAALGVGISQSSSALSQFPESITIIFGKTPVVIATIMAVLLNLILPQENKDQ